MSDNQKPIKIRPNISARTYAPPPGPITAGDAPADSDPLGFDQAVLPDPRQPLAKPSTAEDAPPPAAPKPAITLATTVQHRGRRITITATDMTADQFCDLLDRRGFAPPDEPREWQTLPDGTPICPRHNTPMRQRSKQGDTWYSHNVGTKDEPIYCRGYHGKDSPGYEK
jgi:hypothetical protein